jgi:AcrR family transcriptional regulator
MDTPDIDELEHLGLRERNKRDKLRRIKAAAWALFQEKGYDAATTREIAIRAGVGLGTVFSYAADKRDLLFLLYNDHQEFLTREAFVHISGECPFAEQLMKVFHPYYAFFAEEPVYARYLLRELTFYQTGVQAQRFTTGRERIVDGIEALTRKAIANGKVREDSDPRLVAKLVFGIYQSEVRSWLAHAEPTTEHGLKRLHHVFAMLVDGIGAATR